jgi:hypothetical protein
MFFAFSFASVFLLRRAVGDLVSHYLLSATSAPGSESSSDADVMFSRCVIRLLSDWGEDGYFRILRGSSETGGECAIESITVSAIPILPQ